MKKSRPVFVLSLVLLTFAARAGAQEFGSVDIVVAKKDFLINICKTYGIDPARIPHIAAANRLANPNVILPGQIIRVPVEWIGGMEDEGIVDFFEGDVTRKARSESSWGPLKLKDVVRSGDELRTGDDGRLEIVFGSGNVLALRPQTGLTVLLTKKFDEKNFFQRILLGAGKIVARVKEVTGRTSRYEVKTPSAVAAARGTDFRIGLAEGETTRAEVAKGLVGVEATGVMVEVGEGEGTVVRRGEPPQEPRKLLPPPAFVGPPGEIDALPFTLGMSDVAGASAYRIVLSTGSDVRAVVKEFLVKAGEMAVLAAGLDPGSYLLATAALDADGLEGPLSAPSPLVIRAAAPLEPRVPVNGAIIAGPAIDILWPDIPRTGLYHFQIAEDEEFNRLVFDRLDSAAASSRLPVLKPGLYWLRTRMISESGKEGRFGPVRKFQVIPLPHAPRLSEPEIKGKAVRFTCGDLGPGVVYRFQLSGDDRFGTMLEELISPEPGIAFLKPSDAGVYYARVAAVSSDGFEGPFSEIRAFRIARDGLFRFICMIPAVILLIVLFI